MISLYLCVCVYIYAYPAPQVPALKEGMILVRLCAIVVAPMARTYLELPGNNTGAEETRRGKG